MPIVAETFISDFLAAFRQQHGDVAGTMTAELLAPLPAQLRFLDGEPADEADHDSRMRLLRYALDLTLTDHLVASDEAHPFQAVLNALRAHLRSPPTAPRDRRIWQKQFVHSVERLTNLGADAATDLSRLAEDIAAFSARRRRREQVARQRAEAAERAQSRLRGTREEVAEIVRNLLTRLLPPPPVAEFVSGPWENVVILYALRHGSDGLETSRAIRTAQHLVRWSLSDRPLADRLASNLIDGLAMVGFTREDGQRCLQELETDLRALADVQEAANVPAPSLTRETTEEAVETSMDEPVMPAAEPSAAVADEAPAVEFEVIEEPLETTDEILVEVIFEEPVQTSVEPEIEVSAVPREAAAARALESVADASAEPPSKAPPAPQPARAGPEWVIGGVKVARGTWIEFLHEDGGRVRGKLSWVSPVSHNLLFVDERGIKLVDMTVDELRASVASRECRVLSGGDGAGTTAI